MITRRTPLFVSDPEVPYRKRRTRKLTSKESAAVRAIRNRYRDQPTLDELLGPNAEPHLGATVAAIASLFRKLKTERVRQGLSLAALARKSGIEKVALSKLENGRQTNPTIDTLQRYAAALGQVIKLQVRGNKTRRASIRA